MSPGRLPRVANCSRPTSSNTPSSLKNADNVAQPTVDQMTEQQVEFAFDVSASELADDVRQRAVRVCKLRMNGQNEVQGRERVSADRDYALT